MDKLFQGAIKFKEEDYIQHKDLYTKLKTAQNPNTLFVGCSDSRVDPSRITGSLPGDLFVIRNVGNIIPPFAPRKNLYPAITSAIEYAIKVLNVENIIICGHSNCGACQAIYDETLGSNAQYFQKWIELLHPVKEQVALFSPKSKARRTWLTEQINIQVQIKNLLTYPFVREKLDNNRLKISGWYYIIETGEIMNYDLRTQKFRVINKNQK